MSDWLTYLKDKFAARYLLKPINTAVKSYGFRDKSCDRNCALRNVARTFAVAPQSSSALYMRYACATPTLAVAGDRWRYNYGLCDVRSSVVNHDQSLDHESLSIACVFNIFQYFSVRYAIVDSDRQGVTGP